MLKQTSMFDRAAPQPLAARLRPETLDELLRGRGICWAQERCSAA